MRYRLLHCVPFFVARSTVIQSFHPLSVLSHSAVLLHVSLGLPLFLFPSGAQVSVVLGLSYFSLVTIQAAMYFYLISLILSSMLLISVLLCSSCNFSQFLQESPQKFIHLFHLIAFDFGEYAVSP